MSRGFEDGRFTGRPFERAERKEEFEFNRFPPLFHRMYRHFPRRWRRYW
ncbi:MAG: hypothetical protein FWC32_12665 [Firmicutes bacterium]|nr:hypothetical protein [Bacillota bacterium]